MSIMTRIIALELAYKPKVEGPKLEEYLAARNRREARIQRGLRALAERVVRRACADLEPIEFNVEVGEVLGERELWSPYNIWVEGRHLSGQLNTPEQQRYDDDIINRWRAAQGMEPVRSISDMIEIVSASCEGYESSPTLPGQDPEQLLRQEAQRMADEYGVVVGDVLEEVERFAERVERLREHLERKAAEGGGGW